MHRLRTCAARLRPLTASQAAQTVGQQRPVSVTSAGGTRTFQPIRCYTAPVASEPFLNGTSSNYVEEMYYAWLENPKSVHKVRRRGAAGRSATVRPVTSCHVLFVCNFQISISSKCNFDRTAPPYEGDTLRPVGVRAPLKGRMKLTALHQVVKEPV